MEVAVPLLGFSPRVSSFSTLFPYPFSTDLGKKEKADAISMLGQRTCDPSASFKNFATFHSNAGSGNSFGNVLEFLEQKITRKILIRR